MIWIVQVNAKNGTVTDDVVRKQAEIFEQQMNISNFSYSNGWLHWFKQGLGLSQQKKHGKTADVDLDVEEEGRTSLRAIIEQYDMKVVYNMDETALFYQLQFDKTIAHAPVKGCKKNKHRNTIAFSCNSDSSNKRTMTVIERFL
ncbi:tigger transposable element-derived protein 6-like [Centruroides sculpturatus]|uniref:tigger transposable element-derived protein 6-like n=1 Tax=Centruroides sculpturatus TaxID=218467 RepID=UPI000C6DEC98|nr:tigger transposable element-derived protein 6-like [Centruroides sculpturatus]